LIKAGKINRKRKTPDGAEIAQREDSLSAFFEDNPINFEAVRVVEEKHKGTLGYDPCWSRERDFD
jgi:hypothetical protein